MPSKDTQFKKGNSGKPKGTKKKVCTDIAVLITDDFKQRCKEGYLKRLALSEPAVYASLVRACLPKQIQAEITGSERLPIEIIYTHRKEKTNGKAGKSKAVHGRGKGRAAKP